MTKKIFALVLRLTLLIPLLAGVILQPQYPVFAAAILDVTPLTWNIIGLDSNSPATGPYRFPVGARICNSGTTDAANVVVDFVWDSANSNINLRPGSLSSITVPTIAVGSCYDAYFEVEVTRVAGAYDTSRQYHITATDSLGATGSTPVPRSLYVEHLISQNRNSITNVQLNGTSIPAGGSMNLVVGNTYTITLFGGTATQGYEQFEAFINFPNTIFQILSVSTTYSANTSNYVSSPNDKLYADACLWENDPNSPNYRSCVGMPGKTGGSNVVTTYTIRIIGGGGTTQTLNTLLYDFSGSSYHYNADYSTGARFANIIDPANVTIAKSFSPNPTNINGVSALTITLTNPNPGVLSGYNFTDPLPATLTVASSPGAVTTNCGTPTFSPLSGATSISFSNGTIAANGSCTIKVNVTPSTTGLFVNTTNNLFINSLDTGRSAISTLTVNSAPPAPSPVCGLTMAQWTFSGFITNPPPFPTADTQASNVTTAAISVGNGLTAQSDTTTSGGNPQPGIRTYGWQNAGPIITAASAFIQFAIDTSQYSQVTMQFDAQRKANGPNNNELHYSTNGLTWTLKNTFNSTTSWATYGPYNFTGQTSTTGITYFRIYGYGANATSSGNDFNLDNVTFTGCATPTPPSITKAFSPNPIAVNGTSTLNFTLSNSNSIALTGAAFTDTLPSGLQVSTTPAAATTCGGAPTWAPTAGATTLTFGTPTGATIPASGSCTVSVSVTGTVDGSYQNVSGFISSINGGTNTGSTGSASATLTILKPPAISKLFAPNPILANGTSTLTFSISNPNLNNALTGIAYSDVYPAGVTNTNPLGTSNSCGGILTAAAGGNSISLSGGTISAGGSCTISTTVTASSVGAYANTSNAVSSTNGGTGNTASNTLTVNQPNPAISILKQVSTSTAGPWTSFVGVPVGTNIYYRFSVENAGDVALTSVSVTDPNLNIVGCTWADGDGDPLTAPFTLPVAEAADDDHIAVCVLGPISAATGSHPNTATATGIYAAIAYSDASTATYATTGLTLDKTASQTSFNLAGDTLNYSYLVTNNGFAPLVGPVTVTDDKATVACPAVNTVGDNDNFLDPGESITCTATYTVTLADFIAGSVTNTASATTGGISSNFDGVTVYRALADLIVTKGNNVGGTVGVGNSFVWTITVDNTGLAAGVFGLGNVILSDTLPGTSGYYPQGALTVTNGGIAPIGTINCSITGTALSCVANTIVTMPIGASFSITFTTTPTAVGVLANTVIVDPNGNVLELNETNNTYSDTVTVLGPPSISKSFGTATVNLGETSLLSFTITNPNTTTVLTGVAVTDVLPAGLTVADGTFNACGGTNNLITTAGTGTIVLTGGTILANGSCTFNVTVTGATMGVKNNTTGNVTSANGGTGNTANASITVVAPDLIVTKTNSVTGTVAQNGTFNWTIVVANNGTGTASFADTQTIVSDPLPGAAGYYPQGSLTVTNGGTPPTGTISCSITGTALSCVANGAVTLPVGASFSVTFAVTPTAAGSLANTVTADPGTIVIESDETNNTGSDTVTVLASPSISKSFSPNPTVANVNSTLTFTITNSNTGTILTGVAFSDTYPVGLVNAIPLSSTNTCGGALTATGGGGNISLSGGSIAANSSCTITIDVVAAAGGTYPNISGNITSTSGGTGNTASSTLTVFDAQPSKSIVATSETFTNLVAATERVAIGEMVRYRLATLIPEGSFTNVQLLDGLPSGLQFLNDNTAIVAFVCNSGAACMTSSTLSGAGLVISGSSSNVSPTFSVPGSAISGGPFGSGTDVTFSLGDLTNSDTDGDSEYVVVEFNALVLNVNSSVTINQGVDNQTGASNTNNRQNDVTLLVNGSTVGSTSPNVTVAIAEPAITSITKSVSPASGLYLPGDSLTYTLSFNNNATGNNATTAFDIVLTDTFDSNHIPGTVNVSSMQGATCAGGTIFSTGNSTVAQLVTVNVSCLDPGSSVTVTVNATISNAAPSGTTIANSSSLTYTSLPGAQGDCSAAPFTCITVGVGGTGTGERNGSGGAGADGIVLNNYAATSNTVNTTVAFGSIVVTKNTVPNDAQDFNFIGAGPNGYDFGGGFNLDDDADGTLPNSQTFTPLPAGSYTVTEGSVGGWSPTGLTCTDPDGGSTTDLGTATASIDLDAGESIACTFTNTQDAPAVTLTKTGTLNDDDGTPGLSAGDTISYAFTVTNTGNVTLTNITLTDTVGGVSISGGPIASLASGASDNTTFTGSYNITQAYINSGSFTNTATVTGSPPSGPDVTDPDSDTQTLTGSPAITLTKTGALNDDDGTPGLSAGDTISYAFTVQNSGNVTLTNITLADTVGGVTISGGPIASLAPGSSNNTTFTGSYTLTQPEIDAGIFTNTATVTGTPPSGPDVTDPDSDTQTLTRTPSITLTKTGTLNDDDGTPGLSAGDTISYTFTIQNTGNVTLTNITLADTVGGVTVSGGPIASLAPGAGDNTTFTGSYTLTQTDVNAGTFTNTATVTGTPPSGPNVSDPDSDTRDLTAVLVADPAISKAGDPTQAAVGEIVTFTLTVTNLGNSPAPNVVITDALPAQFDVTAVNVSGAPFGTSVNVTPLIGTGSAPYTVVVTLGGDLGVPDVVTIDIVTTVNGLGSPPITNTARLVSSSNTDLASNNSDSVVIVTRSPRLNLPDTGFAPGVATTLPDRLHEQIYAATDLLLEIPNLGVKMPIVGVPLTRQGWEVAWLGNQAGWLEGSAFPSWSGNSVLTGHVYDSNGLPGPFARLNTLKYGDKFIVHAFGQKYVFEVHTNQVVSPDDVTALKHEEKSWLTLVTCKEYDDATNSYKKRVVVRAVLVRVYWE